MAALHIAQLQVRHAQALCQLLRLAFKHQGCILIECGHAPVNGKRQAGECIAKHAALDMPQWQHPTNDTASLRVEVIGIVTKQILDQRLPP